MHRTGTVVIAALLAISNLAGAGTPVGDKPWLTPAEASGYRATPTLAEIHTFLDRLAPRLPEMRVSSFGVSAEGRDIPLVVVSDRGAFTPEAARVAGLPVVMVQCGVHAGEIDGSDAVLALLRDWAFGRRRGLIGAATILFVPVFNVDGHEHTSPFNRANQLGPETNLGFRTTSDGLDLNRDFLKAQAPETRALLSLVNAWHPDLHVDIHVTDGSDHDWVLTYSWAEAPQLPAPIDGWMRAQMPAVFAQTERAGHRCGPYVELVDSDDPSKGFGSWVGGGRFATGYFPLRNRPSVLIEMHSYKPYSQRVPAVHDFLVALLERLGSAGRGLQDAVRTADRDSVERGAPGAAPTQAVLEFEPLATGEAIRFPIYAWSLQPSTVTGAPLLRYARGTVRETTVPWIHRVSPKRLIARPRGYLVLPGWPAVETALAAHGLRTERLAVPRTVAVEESDLSQPQFARSTYQGLVRVTASVARRHVTRAFPAGTLWIPADQPDFDVAIQLLEPECPESLLAWGLLSSVFERKEYIDSRRLEELALATLANDPESAAAWRAALADPQFAADRRRRSLWWYERTAYFAVQQVGVLPAFRVMSAQTLP